MNSTPHPLGSGQSLPGKSFQQACSYPQVSQNITMVSVLTADLGWEENGRLKGLIAQEQI